MRRLRLLPRSGDQRGVAFPSPVAILSVVAIAMAGIAYVATQGEQPTEREVTAVSQPDDPTTRATTSKPHLPHGKRAKIKQAEPKVVRGETYVAVYNNSGITGLAARYAGTASEVGWQVVGEDNWYGTIPASTVYYPERLEAAGKQLALDLGIDRTMPAVANMDRDRLTVVLTADAG